MRGYQCGISSQSCLAEMKRTSLQQSDIFAICIGDKIFVVLYVGLQCMKGRFYIQMTQDVIL